MVDDGTNDTPGGPSRRELLLAAGTGVAGTSGCLRFSQETGQSTTDADSTTRTTATATETTEAESETTTGDESAESVDFPPLDIERVDEKGLGSSSSSPATKIDSIGDDRLVTVGGKQIAVYEADTLSERLSVEIPDVINTGHHGLSVVSGEVYATVGGSVPSRVKRIDVSEGEVWSFEEDEFGPNVSRNVPDPVVTEDYVIYVAATTENRDGANSSQWYILDRESGELVEKPPMSTFEDGTCFIEGIAAGNGVVALSGCTGYYFYDLDSMEYLGNESGFLASILTARDGTLYTGSEAFDLESRTADWSTKTSGANRDLLVSGDSVFYIYNDTATGLQRADGSQRWSYGFETLRPKNLLLADDAVWITTGNTSDHVGHIVKLDSETGEVIGATEFGANQTDRVRPEPYDICKLGDSLFVGSSESIVRYKTG